MKLLYLLALAPLLQAQQLQPVVSQQADCGKFSTPIRVAGTFTTAIVDNRQAGCDGWVVTYSSNGFATVSVLLQDAPLGVGGIAGAFVSFAGTIVAPTVNPAVATTQGEIRATGYYPYIRVQITTTGTGYLQAEFHGFKNNPNSGSGAPAAGASGCVGTIATPCVVIGPTAAGAAATKSPVMVSGVDSNVNVRTLRTDFFGNMQVVGPTTEGQAINTAPVVIAGNNNGGVNKFGTDGLGGMTLGSTTPFAADAQTPLGTLFDTQSGFPLFVYIQPWLFNGTTYDRARGDATHGALVQQSGNSAVLSGQQAVTNAAVALASNASKNICVKALAGNTANVYIGPTGITIATGMELAAGDAYCGPVTNTNLLFVIAAAGGQSISWLATN
jgi:hypothetical protein